MTRLQKSILRTIRACKKANAELSRIHPEFATPKLLSDVQRCARSANESHIGSLKTLAKLAKHMAAMDKKLKQLERLARRLSNERDDP